MRLHSLRNMLPLKHLARVGAVGALRGRTTPTCMTGVRHFSQFIGGNDEPSSSVTTRTNETVVFKSNAQWPWYVGKGAGVQMYAAVALTAQIVYSLPDTASYIEIIATAGPLASASAFLFFGTKYMCDRVISTVTNCRTIGQRDEFLKVTVAGVLAPKTFEVLPRDVKLIAKDDKGLCTLKIHRTTFWLDTAKAELIETKSLDVLLSGKPLLVRREKQSKHHRK
ncbi:Aste57867_22022 [Aphanomyces stellatus]|uniref:Aste57867_22022 protein n=1 Tax=Aphanomyces stellatus TaxID=120398 RepID=A0A485LJR8_9STRA|nr:hypothetical protein As57867_021953 [Aphanomyces stellatus]VFT98690.1 Aste57867_22022 [Aphanomyces stellatus]